MKMFIVDHDGGDVAAGVYHVFGDTIELIYNGSARALARRCVPTTPCYWERDALGRRSTGLRRIDLGGAYADTPLARFKQQWGAEPQPRFRLNHRAGGEVTRAESIASIGYGAEGSERRLVDFAWRHVPLAAAARRCARRLPLRMSARAVQIDPLADRALGRVRTRTSALRPCTSSARGREILRERIPLRAALPGARGRGGRAARRAAAAPQEGPRVGRARALAARVPGRRPAGRLPRGRARADRGCARRDGSQRRARAGRDLAGGLLGADLRRIRRRRASAPLGGGAGDPDDAAGRMAQDLEQPLPQPEEGRQGGVHLPRGQRAPATCSASTACTCARCESTARCPARCASWS